MGMIGDLFGTDSTTHTGGSIDQTVASDVEAVKKDTTVVDTLSNTEGISKTQADTGKTGEALTKTSGTTAQSVAGSTAANSVGLTSATTAANTKEAGVTKNNTSTQTATDTISSQLVTSQNQQNTVADALQTDSGYTTTQSGSTNSTQLQISDAGVQSLISSILGGTQGLASVASGEHVAGMYNTSTGEQLINDLIARTVGAVAEKTGITVQNIGGSNAVVGTRTIGNTSTQATTATGTQSTVGRSSQTGASDTQSLSASVKDTQSKTVADTLAAQTSSTLSKQDTKGTSDTTSAQTSKENTTATTLQDLSSTTTGKNTSVLDSVLDTKGIQSTKGSNTSVGEARQQGLFEWVICTELLRQKKMPMCWYIPGAAVFSRYPETVKRGYHLWAVPYVRLMRRSSLATAAVTAIFNWRAENIAAHALKNSGARKLWRGAAITVLLYPTCFFLGLFTSSKEKAVSGLYSRLRRI